MGLDFLGRGQVQVSVYCSWRILAHLRCTQCSILSHLMDICFLTCICLWIISQIQTYLCVFVRPGFVSTSPAFMRSSASHPTGQHDRLPIKNGKSGPHCWGREISTQFAQQFVSAVTAPPLVGCLVWSFIKFIANYIKGRKANTTHRNPTSSQRQFKTGVPQGGVLCWCVYPLR